MFRGAVVGVGPHQSPVATRCDHLVADPGGAQLVVGGVGAGLVHRECRHGRLHSFQCHRPCLPRRGRWPPRVIRCSVPMLPSATHLPADRDNIPETLSVEPLDHLGSVESQRPSKSDTGLQPAQPVGTQNGLSGGSGHGGDLLRRDPGGKHVLGCALGLDDGLGMGDSALRFGVSSHNYGGRLRPRWVSIAHLDHIHGRPNAARCFVVVDQPANREDNPPRPWWPGVWATFLKPPSDTKPAETPQSDCQGDSDCW